MKCVIDNIEYDTEKAIQIAVFEDLRDDILYFTGMYLDEKERCFFHYASYDTINKIGKEHIETSSIEEAIGWFMVTKMWDKCDYGLSITSKFVETFYSEIADECRMLKNDLYEKIDRLEREISELKNN